MTFNYKDKEYILMEMKRPNSNETHDIVGVFEIVYMDIDTDKILTKEDYFNCEDGSVIEKYVFVDYYYGVDEDEDELIYNAKEVIDWRNL